TGWQKELPRRNACRPGDYQFVFAVQRHKGCHSREQTHKGYGLNHDHRHAKGRNGNGRRIGKARKPGDATGQLREVNEKNQREYTEEKPCGDCRIANEEVAAEGPAHQGFPPCEGPPAMRSRTADDRSRMRRKSESTTSAQRVGSSMARCARMNQTAISATTMGVAAIT